MRAVQNSHLALLVGGVIVGDKDGQACFFKGQVIFNVLGSLNDPETKNFSCVDEYIPVAKLFAQGISLRFGETGDNAVYQC